MRARMYKGRESVLVETEEDLKKVKSDGYLDHPLEIKKPVKKKTVKKHCLL